MLRLTGHQEQVLHEQFHAGPRCPPLAAPDALGEPGSFMEIGPVELP